MEFNEFLEHAMENVPNGAKGHFSKCMGKPIRGGSDEDYYDD